MILYIGLNIIKKRIFMNVSKKLFGIIITSLLGTPSLFSAPDARQKIQKLETIKAQLLAINTSPVLSAGVNPSDATQLKSMVTEDIKNIKDDLKRIQSALRALIDNEIESLK